MWFYVKKGEKTHLSKVLFNTWPLKLTRFKHFRLRGHRPDVENLRMALTRESWELGWHFVAVNTWSCRCNILPLYNVLWIRFVVIQVCMELSRKLFRVPDSGFKHWVRNITFSFILVNLIEIVSTTNLHSVLHGFNLKYSERVVSYTAYPKKFGQSVFGLFL